MVTPKRSCVVCRKRAAKETLLRFVLRENTPLLDLMQVDFGRGAYCHPTLGCAFAPGVDSLLLMMLAVEKGSGERQRRRKVRRSKGGPRTSEGPFVQQLLTSLRTSVKKSTQRGEDKKRFRKLLCEVETLCQNYETQQGTETKQTIRL